MAEQSTNTSPTASAYPLPRPADDPKFNIGFLADVIRVIEQHGYPAIHQGRDIVRLQQALFGFIYGEAGRS